MATRITPNFIELTYEATVQSFWYKTSLSQFLSNHDYNLPFNSEEESKRIFLRRVFANLQKNDKGRTIIYKIANSLLEKTTFSDFNNREDSSQHKKNAEKAIDDLRKYKQKQDEDMTSEKEKANKRKEAFERHQSIQRKQTTHSSLRAELDLLAGSLLGTQKGGYQFEEWFHKLLEFCEIEHKIPYKHGGRQIDGSLTHEGTTYLLELKCTKKPIGVEAIDSIKAKIEKMADNTMGVMLSMSGYTQPAIASASGPKTTLLLLDHAHLYSFLTGSMTKFSMIIERVRRHASQTGESYLAVDKFGS